MSRIVFMGSPDFAVPSLRALTAAHALVGVVTQPDRPAGRGRGLRPPPVKLEAGRLGIPVIQPAKVGTPVVVQQLSEWDPDVIVVAAFGQILRPSVLGLPAHGCVNVHASLLPRWRGAAPIQAAIAAGDADTGITIMKMDEGLDTGGILAQRSSAIAADETGGSLTQRLAALGADLLCDTLPAYLDGRLQPQPQDADKATKAPLLRKEDGLLDPAMPAEVLARRVRAFQPWPGTYLYHEGLALKVIRAHAAAGGIAQGRRAVLDMLPAWGTIKGVLVLDEVQLAGKKAMGGADFLMGSHNWVS